MDNKMFCFQCEQTAGCTGCTGAMGVCGKSADTSKLQDELTGALIGLAKSTSHNPKRKETDKIIKAQKSRGADFMTGNILKRVKAFMPILIPLFISAFRRADDLAMAMEARCYHGGVGRTRLKQLSFASRDYIAMTAFIGILLILTVIKIVFPHMVLFTL